jgi:phage anti-repressor protein
MNDLIKVTINEKGQQLVSAKELYLSLGFDKSNWASWSKKNIIDNPFSIENEDWVGFVVSKNGNLTKEFALTIEFAKRVSMMARTEKGEELRKYFIECENKLIQQKPELPQIPQTYAQALRLAADQQEVIEQQAKQLEFQAPAVEFAYSIKKSVNSIEIEDFAKIIGEKKLGRNNMFKLFRLHGILNKDNTPNQYYINNKTMELDPRVRIHNGKNLIYNVTMVTAKGIIYFQDYLKKKGFI